MTETREFRRLGPYLLVRTSGAGGMGRVELALRADQLDRDICVIKRMHSEGRSDDQEARFRREAQIAARLENDNIARTLLVEDINGEPCLAQEFVEGVDLGGIMRQFRPRNLPVAAAVHVVKEVCHGLGYAHDFGGHGIVHRDVTPENIMVSFDGEVKLIDFGIARSAVDGTLTNVGVIIGRREYIAPESWEGEKADRRVDIYALGVVLWELLTGRRLEGSTEVGPGKRPPDPSTVNAGIPPAVSQVVIRALAENCARRSLRSAFLRPARERNSCNSSGPTSKSTSCETCSPRTWRRRGSSLPPARRPRSRIPWCR
jgi:eukaryotic-like serine/threonine-protein kinase